MASGSPAMNKIETAHQMYRDGKYSEALNYYTDALSMAKTKAQKIALHSNRAACYLKLHDFIKAAQECTSVLELDHNHTGALMLRAQTLVTLKEYQSALFDVNRLIELNPSSEVYRNLQVHLKTQLTLATIPEEEAEFDEEDEHVDGANLEEFEAGEQSEEEMEQVIKQVNAKTYNAQMEKDKQSKCDDTTPVTAAVSTQTNNEQKTTNQPSSGWQKIPKPKGHSHLDYSRWDSVGDASSDEEDSSEDDDDDVGSRFRVKNVGIRAVK